MKELKDVLLCVDQNLTEGEGACRRRAGMCLCVRAFVVGCTAGIQKWKSGTCLRF